MKELAIGMRRLPALLRQELLAQSVSESDLVDTLQTTPGCY
jgi:hypothetical protein